MPKILIINGKVWDGDRFFASGLYIENGVIKLVSKTINIDADFVYDATGQIVSPGLVDAHLHMRKMSSDVIGVGDWACFPFGVTAAVDAWVEQSDALAINGSMVKSLGFIGTIIEKNHIRQDLVEPLFSEWKDRAIGIKVCFDTSSSDVCDITVVKEAVEIAERRGLKVLVHCNRSPIPMMEIVKALRKGDILTHAYHGGQNNASKDGFACLKYAREKGVVIDAGFAGNVHTDFGVYREALKNGFAPDIISSDLTLYSAFKRGGRYGITSCMNIAKECGQDEESIFRCVTSTPAKAVGKANEWGYLKEGRVADVCVIAYEKDSFDLKDDNGNRVRWDNGYRCKLTIANGEVVYRD